MLALFAAALVAYADNAPLRIPFDEKKPACSSKTCLFAPPRIGGPR